MSGTAKLFMHGRSQAVRLPKEFRLPGTEVRVRRDGEKVILEPLAAIRPEATTVWARIDAMREGEDLFDIADAAEGPSTEDVRAWFDEP